MRSLLLFRAVALMVTSSWQVVQVEYVAVGEEKVLSDAACAELGFTREKLSCDTCDAFLSVEHDLFDECQACCVVQEKSTPKKYESAVIYVDDWLMKARYPMIGAFIDDKMSKYKSVVKVKPSRGAKPYIKLLTAEQKSSEKISIESWKTEDLEEFLEQKLKISI